MVLSYYYALLQSFNIICECYNNYFLLKSSISIERKYNCCILSQHLSDVQRILTYEPRNCAHSCQTFKLFLTVSPAHKIITTLT